MMQVKLQPLRELNSADPRRNLALRNIKARRGEDQGSQ
jgi:hypothetical protein